MSKYKTIIVDNKEMTSEEFLKFKETLTTDKSKKLKEVSPGKFVVLSRMQG